MNRQPPSVDDIYVALLERISAGAFALGSRLPSCRNLATDLDSNPSTVSRALQRLSADGLVRTEARRGTFVTATEPPETSTRVQVTAQLEKVVAGARAAGFEAEVIRQMFSAVVASAYSTPAVAFVECNKYDLSRMSGVVENATGVTCKPLLLDQVDPSSIAGYDVIATPIFHLADVAAVLDGLDRVVELNFVPSPGALRQIAMLDADASVVVAAPTDRGVERLGSLVRQYFPGQVKAFSADRTGVLDQVGGDVLVTTHAMGLTEADLAAMADVVLVDWELDPTSAASFSARVDAALLS